MRYLHLKILLFFIVVTSACYAQEADKSLSAQRKDSTSLLRGTHKAKSAKSLLSLIYGSSGKKSSPGSLKIAHFVIPGYSPDTKLALAGGAIASFRTQRNDSLLPLSTVPITVSYSSARAFIASSAIQTFWMHDKLRINAFMQYRNSGSIYYGMGYNAAMNTPSDSTNLWGSNFTFALRPLWRVRKNIYGGVFFLYDQSILSHVNPHIASDSFYTQYGSFYRNTGIGSSITFDTRDVPQNAYKGLYISLTYSLYNKALGGTTHYQLFDFDTRAYFPLSNKRMRVLALNWRSRYYFGTPAPTSVLPLGLSIDLRGLAFGKFRNYKTNYFLAEYRHKFYNRLGEPSRFGFVVWSGVGAIGNNFNNAMFKQVLPDFGIGLRFEILPRLNLRGDEGFAPTKGKSSNATFFNFLESF